MAGAASDLWWFFAIGGMVSAPGAWLVLAAGRSERTGAIERARRQVRRGGLLMAGGALVSIAGDVVAFVANGLSSPNAPLLWTRVVIAAAAGFAGLLAGLSGKPRPTGYLAAALFVGAVVTWLAAL